MRNRSNRSLCSIQKLKHILLAEVKSISEKSRKGEKVVFGLITIITNKLLQSVKEGVKKHIFFTVSAKPHFLPLVRKLWICPQFFFTSSLYVSTWNITIMSHQTTIHSPNSLMMKIQIKSQIQRSRCAMQKNAHKLFFHRIKRTTLFFHKHLFIYIYLFIQ